MPFIADNQTSFTPDEMKKPVNFWNTYFKVLDNLPKAGAVVGGAVTGIPTRGLLAPTGAAAGNFIASEYANRLNKIMGRPTKNIGEQAAGAAQSAGVASLWTLLSGLLSPEKLRSNYIGNTGKTQNRDALEEKLLEATQPYNLQTKRGLVSPELQQSAKKISGELFNTLYPLGGKATDPSLSRPQTVPLNTAYDVNKQLGSDYGLNSGNSYTRSSGDIKAVDSAARSAFNQSGGPMVKLLNAYMNRLYYPVKNVISTPLKLLSLLKRI